MELAGFGRIAEFHDLAGLGPDFEVLRSITLRAERDNLGEVVQFQAVLGVVRPIRARNRHELLSVETESVVRIEIDGIGKAILREVAWAAGDSGQTADRPAGAHDPGLGAAV